MKIWRIEESPLDRAEVWILENVFTKIYNAVGSWSQVVREPSLPQTQLKEQWPRYLERASTMPHTQQYLHIQTRGQDRREDLIEVRTVVIQHHYSIDELRGMAWAEHHNIAPDTHKARAGRHAMARKQDEMCRVNDAINLFDDTATATKIPREVAEAVVPIEFEHLAPVWGNQANPLGVTCTMHARVGGLAIHDHDAFDTLIETMTGAAS